MQVMVQDNERLCVGCRNRDDRAALLRFAMRDEEPRLVPDPMRRLPGRGVSVHPRRSCVDAAVRKGGFAKALRGRLGSDTDQLCDLARIRYEDRVRGLLLSAARNKVLALGTAAVRDAMRERSVRLLVVAADAAGRRAELEEAAAELGRRCIVFGTKEKLGAYFGRAELGVLSIAHPGIAKEVAATAARATDLSEAE